MQKRSICFFFVAAFATALSAAELRVPVKPAAGEGAVVFQAPDAWRSRVVQAGAGLPTLVEFTPANGAAFKVLLSLIPPRGDAPPLSREFVAAAATRAAAKAAQRSVEPAPLEIKELTGAAIYGSYFSATDRQPEPQGFKHLTQGTVVIGTSAVGFTVLANDESKAVEQQALQMLASARPAP